MLQITSSSMFFMIDKDDSLVPLVKKVGYSIPTAHNPARKEYDDFKIEVSRDVIDEPIVEFDMVQVSILADDIRKVSLGHSQALYDLREAGLLN